MTLQALLFLVSSIKRIQGELRTNELLNGLTLKYSLPEKEHSIIQRDIYKHFHPTMEGFVENDVFEVVLLDVNFIFEKKK